MAVSYPSSTSARDSTVDYDTADMPDRMDLDIDLGSVDGGKIPTALANTLAEHLPSSQIPDTDLAPHKVYIRGLEDLTTSDIMTFYKEYYSSETLPHIEWIDDTSANLVFEGKEIAIAALQHLTLGPNENRSLPLTQLRAAKSLFTHPGSTLYVRIATITDQKRPRAYEASRFYMMHPEHDPREQRRRGANDYEQKGRPNDKHPRKRRRDEEDRFDNSMYDDDSASSRRDLILSPVNKRTIDKRKCPQLRSDMYRPEWDGTRGSRDRSASPNARNRQTPPPTYRSRDPHPFPYENAGKELFPLITRHSGDTDHNTKDLFSSKMLTAGKDFYLAKSMATSEAVADSNDQSCNRRRALEVKKELFPHKVSPHKHNRSGAFDAADETADLFANQILLQSTDRLSTRKSAFARPTSSDPQSQMGGGPIDIGLNIRGASTEQKQGFLIRGGAAFNGVGMIKELFPRKNVGNAGKEAFAEKIEGRGQRMNRAEDMLY